MGFYGAHLMRLPRLRSELAASQQRLADEGSAWEARCDGLRRALEAQEARSVALEQQLAAGPTAKQVLSRGGCGAVWPVRVKTGWAFVGCLELPGAGCPKPTFLGESG
jgi:hypothetical protein